MSKVGFYAKRDRVGQTAHMGEGCMCVPPVPPVPPCTHHPPRRLSPSGKTGDCYKICGQKRPFLRTHTPTGARNCPDHLSYRSRVRGDNYRYFVLNSLGVDRGESAGIQLMQLVVPPRLTREPRGERGSLKIYKCAGGLWRTERCVSLRFYTR